MTIPFLDFFKKKGTKEVLSAPVAAPVHVEKPSSERLSKTVMPNTTRVMGPHDSFQMGTGSPASTSGRQSISFGTPAPANRSGGGLPPAVALALEPKVERAISLELADVVRQMPEGMVRPLEGTDASRRVLLKASELERGMAQGRPSISIATVYQQVPEIFLRTIAASDSTQVQLPFEKVLEQFSRLQVRTDQSRAPAVPQVETPFLKVTLEDDARFGTVTEQLETTDLPAVRLETATAETLAAAEPEALMSERAMPAPAKPPQFPASTQPISRQNENGNGAAQVAPVEPAPRTAAPVTPPIPARIPFKLSPKGTDAPASERVPASSGGPSVPTSAPTRIPFKIMPPPGAAVVEKTDAWLTKDNFASDPKTEGEVFAAAAALADRTGVKIALALKPILQSLPPLQIKGDVGAVPDAARIELPFELLEPQLASGRVLLPPAEFARNLPEEYRPLFDAKETGEPVVLPLQEILKNLPATSLQMREDQVEQEQGENFETPFSTTAAEDAKRLNVAPAPIPKPVVVKAVEPVAEAVAALPAMPPTPMAAPAALRMEGGRSGGARSALQTALDTDDVLDAKAVVAHVGKMAGVQACAIMFGDGLSLAGSLPEEFEADGLCAMAPSLLQRVENHMAETKLGPLRAMTLSCSKAAVTFFMHDNLCLAALHPKEELASDVRERLARAVHELSRKYSNPV